MLRAGRGKKRAKMCMERRGTSFPNLEEEKQPCRENGGGDSTKNSPDPGVTHPCAGGPGRMIVPQPLLLHRERPKLSCGTGIVFLVAQGGFSLTCPSAAILDSAGNIILRGNSSL